ncbi:hypothetical protein Ocin01_11856 [Orchesella cincta]|uniref:Uncharacterized protein n=1 Tax=Orchesella cincta TaxID=48709 RepID=A0A1D2MP85_ORCCI|nr:hypothetical protein Ocin01_11856 [Orchesella cincta]
MKTYHPIFNHLLVMSILITSSFARSYPPKCLSQGPTGSKLLLYGRPPRCFQAGLQGPCSVDEILLPRSETLSIGVCREVATTTTEALSEVPIKCGMDVEYYDLDEQDTDSQLTKTFQPNRCQNKFEIYSTILKRCIPNRTAKLSLGVLG